MAVASAADGTVTDTSPTPAAEVGVSAGTVAGLHGETSLAQHVVSTVVGATHRRLVAITLLAEHLVAHWRQNTDHL